MTWDRQADCLARKSSQTMNHIYSEGTVIDIKRYPGNLALRRGA